MKNEISGLPTVCLYKEKKGLFSTNLESIVQ